MGVESQTNDTVPLPNVTGHILQMVIDWADHGKDDPPQDEEDENKEKKIDDIPPWDVDFLKVDQGTLFELILAANYLDQGSFGFDMQNGCGHDQRKNRRGNSPDIQYQA